eukprot:m.342819 g.342819  ORF g.342819 m.342819 type:complete len:388 (-) comp21867_c0_seq1:20-1183(-)
MAPFRSTLFILYVVLHIIHGASLSYSPPLYHISAHTLYDAGVQHGKMAKERIHTWFNSEETQEVFHYATTEGKEAYTQLRTASESAYKVYADELRGIAEGAGLSLDNVWAAQLMIELENLMEMSGVRGTNFSSHCTDISTVSAGGFTKGFVHGHNEDWSPDAGKSYYYIKYTALPGADFESCGGLAYPGALIGWGPTWNRHGVYMSINTLYPKKIDIGKTISTAFIQRDAICRKGLGAGLKPVYTILQEGRWSEGSSANLIDTASSSTGIANVETWTSHSALTILKPSDHHTTNMSHLNMYKYMDVTQGGPWLERSIIRQKILDEQPPPESKADIMDILSDPKEIFSDKTIASMVLDSSGNMLVWDGTAPSTSAPLYTWNLRTFFEN